MAFVTKLPLLLPTTILSRKTMKPPFFSTFRRPSMPINNSSSPLSAPPPPQSSSPSVPAAAATTSTYIWKPICLYYTHGKCTKADDPAHLETFSHDLSSGLEVNGVESGNLQAQNFDYLLVIDLEGKEEILEFPVVMIDAKTLGFVGFFHRFVRPVRMSEQRINQYITGKYGKFGVDRVWHDTTIPFKEVVQEFDVWMTQNHLWDKELGGPLCRAAFVTCGNWDLKTKIPQQCKDSYMELPSYFMEWINLKDIYLNFYKGKAKASGMRSMMNGLGISLVGSHHLGIDDSKNITRVMQRMLRDGALMQITAEKSLSSYGKVEFLFKNRI